MQVLQRTHTTPQVSREGTSLLKITPFNFSFPLSFLPLGPRVYSGLLLMGFSVGGKRVSIAIVGSVLSIRLIVCLPPLGAGYAGAGYIGTGWRSFC